MKKALSVFVQFVLFFVTFMAGTFLRPFKLTWFVTHPTPIQTRYFVPDGLLLMIALFVLFLVIEALMKKLREMGTWTSVAFALALALGLLSKFGFALHDLY